MKKMRNNYKILAIETSCDETAAAVVLGGNNPKALSNIISSQVDLHTLTGGVVPEVASRAHMEAIIPVISKALLAAKYGQEMERIDYSEAISYLRENITGIAYTAGPGLIGSLLVGGSAAKTLAYSLDLPIVPVNHIEGHIYSAFLRERINSNSTADGLTLDKSKKKLNKTQQFSLDHKQIRFPALALTVSGGHTSLTLMTDHGQYKNIGGTLDDSAGEAFDKVAKLLNLGYPGGPIVSKLASQFRVDNQKTSNRRQTNHIRSTRQQPANDNAITLPRPILNDGTLNFSFSGLKTAVLQTVLNIEKAHSLTDVDKRRICFAFEDAVVDVLTTKTIRAAEKFKINSIILAGGVSANLQLRAVFEQKIKRLNRNINFYIPPISLCGDNAVMIGVAANYHFKRGEDKSWRAALIDSNFELV